MSVLVLESYWYVPVELHDEFKRRFLSLKNLALEVGALRANLFVNKKNREEVRIEIIWEPSDEERCEKWRDAHLVTLGDSKKRWKPTQPPKVERRQDPSF